MAAASEVKQLREILQEQQEPFVLQTYLVEKGCSVREKHNSIEDGSFTCCRVTSGKKGQKGVSNFSKVVRNLCNQVGSINGKKLKRNKKKKKSSEAEAAERLSFASCSSPNFNWCCPESDNVEERASCSSSFAEFCNSNEEKIAADGSLQWRCMEDEDQQFSPVSVLERLATHEEDSSPPSNSTVHNYSSGEGIIRKKKEDKLNQVSVDDSIIASASVWGVLLQRAMSRAEAQTAETGDDFAKSSSSDGLEQRKKQLLFDCIQEAVDQNGSSSRKDCCASNARMMRSWAWSRKCKAGDEFELLSDFVVQREWSDDGEQCREIGLAIEDSIFEEIKDEIMVDLISFPWSL